MNIEHIGIIPDGNRRWAKRNNVPLENAYEMFFQHICAIAKCLLLGNIKVLSVYIISSENLQRECEDVKAVLTAFNKALEDLLPDLCLTNKIRINIIGEISKLPFLNQQLLESLSSKTMCFGEFTINMLIGYNPFAEINKIVMEKKSVTIFNLSVPQRVDLIIRTAGGPARLSNFLPLQSGYAALHMFDDYFLDVTCEAIVNIVESYKRIEMRYGR